MQPHTHLKKPFIVPIFIPHAGCPHHCVFCNQHSTTGQDASLPGIDAIRESIRRFLSFRRDNDRWTEISFYGGNFLGLPLEWVDVLLSTAADFVDRGQADGIRFSTRPDTIDADRVRWIAPFPVTTIELGVQSMNDAVLALSDRGHTAEAVRRAVALLRAHPYHLGLQMMVGLPGDTPASALATGHLLAALVPDFIRIYPTLVLKGSRLAHWYARGSYSPMPLNAAVALVADLYRIFSHCGIPVIRMGLQATSELTAETDLVAGPFHPAFGELVRSALWLNALSFHVERQGLHNRALRIEAHPRMISQIRGRQDANIHTLIARYGMENIAVRANPNLSDDRLVVNGMPMEAGF